MIDDRVDHRFSFAMTRELKEQLMARAEEMSSPDRPVRPADICRLALEQYLAGGKEEGPMAVDDFGILEVLDNTSQRLGMSVGSLVNLVLTENLEKYIEQANLRQAKIQQLKRKSQPSSTELRKEPAHDGNH